MAADLAKAARQPEPGVDLKGEVVHAKIVLRFGAMKTVCMFLPRLHETSVTPMIPRGYSMFRKCDMQRITLIH